MSEKNVSPPSKDSLIAANAARAEDELNRQTLKQQVIGSVQEALNQGIIEPSDLSSVLGLATKEEVASKVHSAEAAAEQRAKTEMKHSNVDKDGSRKLSPAEILFAVGGGIMILAEVIFIWQVFAESVSGRIVMTSLIAALCLFVAWSIGLRLHNSKEGEEVQNILKNTLLFNGCFTLGWAFMESYVHLFQDTSAQDETILYTAAALGVLSCIYFAIDRVYRHLISASFGFFTGFAALNTFVFYGMIASGFDDWGVDFSIFMTFCASAALVVAGRVIARMKPYAHQLKDVAQDLALIGVFISVFSGAVTDQASLTVLWQMLLPIMVIGVFYFSINMNSKRILRWASFFLVVYVIFASYKYFSGTNVAIAMFVAAMGVIGAAVLISRISKRLDTSQ